MSEEHPPRRGPGRPRKHPIAETQSAPQPAESPQSELREFMKAVVAETKQQEGRVIWRSKAPQNAGIRGGDGAGYSSIVISKGAGVKQYIQLVGRGVISVEAKTG